jgi:Integrase core domain
MRTQAHRIVDTDPKRGNAVVRVTGTRHHEPTYQVRQSLSITQEVPGHDHHTNRVRETGSGSHGPILRSVPTNRLSQHLDRSSGSRQERLPFRVEVIQTDNGVEFGASFHWHVLDKGAGQVDSKPRTPRLNGNVERSHRIDAEEFYRLLEGVVIDDAQVFNDKLQEWEDFYNYHRPHGGLNGQTPYERLKQRTQARV